MKVVHFNTADFRGGASKMVFRLHHGLRALGVESTYHVRKKITADETIEEVGGQKGRFAERIVKKHLIDAKRSPVTTSPFTFTWDPAGGDFSPRRYAAMDALHLHWIERFLSPRDLAGLLFCGRPVLWTVHDQKPATGGCHWSYDCREFERGCTPCNQLAEDAFSLPERVLEMKKRLVGKAELTLAAPSRWMADVLKASALFGDKDIRIIPHGIETDIFRPGDRERARERCGLAPERTSLLFTAFNADAWQKGLGHLLRTLEICRGDNRYRSLLAEGRLELLVAGKTTETFEGLGLPVTSFGYVESRERLADIFRAAHVLVNPSLAESFSLVSLEAMACGAVVAGFRTGGMTDFIDDKSGVLVPAGRTEDLAQALLGLLFDDEKRQTLSARAAERAGEYSIGQMAGRYRALYEELRERLPAASPPDFEGLDTFRDVIAEAALLETEELLGAPCGLQPRTPESALADCIARNRQSLQEKKPEFYRRLVGLVEKS